MAYADEVLADAPSLYWRLGETSGTTAADASGNARAGTYATDVAAHTVTGLLTGDSNTAVTVGTGSMSQISIPDAAWQDAASWTVEIAAKIAVDQPSGDIVARLGTDGHWELHLRGADGLVQIFTYGPVYTPTFVAVSTTTVDDNTPHHIAATCDGTTLRIYIDGVQEASTSVSGANAGDDTGIRVRDFNFAGTVDEFAYWSGTALSGARIAAHATAGGFTGAGELIPSLADDYTLVAAVNLASETASAMAEDVDLAAALTVARALTAALADDHTLAVAADVAVPLAGWTRDEWDKFQEDVELEADLDVFPAPNLPAGSRLHRRRSETYPDPTLVDGRPT